MQVLDALSLYVRTEGHTSNSLKARDTCVTVLTYTLAENVKPVRKPALSLCKNAQNPRWRRFVRTVCQLLMSDINLRHYILKRPKSCNISRGSLYPGNMILPLPSFESYSVTGEWERDGGGREREGRARRGREYGGERDEHGDKSEKGRQGKGDKNSL